jgi:hypothetical protein
MQCAKREFFAGSGKIAPQNAFALNLSGPGWRITPCGGSLFAVSARRRTNFRGFPPKPLYFSAVKN